MRLTTLARPAVLPLFALALLAAPGLALADQDRTVTVTGEGSASAAPDMASVTAGVTSQAATAREALDANTKATADVIALFKAEGIEPRDIQTSGFSLQPVYVYPKADDGEQKPPRITGYTVSNGVSVKVRDLGKLGAVLDKAVGAGANTVNGINFIVSKQSELLDDARKAAVADARRKAELYAAASGATLGKIVTISEAAAGPLDMPRPMYRMSVAAAPAAVPVEAGESELRVQVSATYRLD